MTSSSGALAASRSTTPSSSSNSRPWLALAASAPAATVPLQARSGSRRPSSAWAGPATFSSSAGSSSPARPRSASITGANGTPSSPSGTQPPRSTRTPCSWAQMASWSASRVLPTPASPPISATSDSPPAARASRSRSSASSSVRPTKRPVMTWCAMSPSMPPPAAGLRLDLGQAAREEGALDRVGGQGQGAAVGGGRLGDAAEAAQQVGAGGVEEVVAVQRAGGGELLDPGEALLRAVGHGDRDRAVQLHDGRGGHAAQGVVERQDAGPVGGLGAGGGGVQGRDGGLHPVGAEPAEAHRPVEHAHPFDDHRRVPAGAVLLVEQDQLPSCAHPRLAPGVVEQQQREQAEGLRLVRHQLGERSEERRVGKE